MMYRALGLLTIGICFLLMLGCGITAKQEWSENYALMEGVRATNLKMIDGNIRTYAKTEFSEGEQATFDVTPSTQAVVIFPEKKVVRRVVVHSKNLKKFNVYADKGNEDWQIIKEVKNVTVTPIDLSVNAPFPTNKVRIRVLGTTDDTPLRRGGRRRAPGEIYEIELYGYKSGAEERAEKAEDQREKELDQQLR
jgi:hypothetical protein